MCATQGSMGLGAWVQTLLWLLWEGTGEAGQAGLGFASVNNFSRF